jgi:hypothetical protein
MILKIMMGVAIVVSLESTLGMTDTHDYQLGLEVKRRLQDVCGVRYLTKEVLVKAIKEICIYCNLPIPSLDKDHSNIDKITTYLGKNYDNFMRYLNPQSHASQLPYGFTIPSPDELCHLHGGSYTPNI